MKQKKPDLKQQYRMDSHQRYVAAPTLKDKYPHVKSVAIAIKFSDSERPKENPEPVTRTFTGESKALFEEDCPYTKGESICRGFNFQSAVHTVLSQKLPSAEGRLVCDGWQDPERVGLHRCRLGAEYTVTPVYES